MRLRFQDFQCSECGFEFEILLDLDEEEGQPSCPHCEGVGKPILGNPKHCRHISWSQWRVDHNK